MGERNAIRKIEYIITAIAISCALLLCALFLIGCGNENDGNSDGSYVVSYTCAPLGGRIDGDKTQSVERGGDAQEVTAVADAGYYFAQWSDGLNTATRKDVGVSDNLSFKAEFAKITDAVSVTYGVNIADTYAVRMKFDGREVCDGSGTAVNEAEQVVQRGTDGWCVEIDASGIDRVSENLLFWQWSDGVKTLWRQDKNITHSFKATALFGCPVRYGTDGRGKIIGENEQIVAYGQQSQTVTAVPRKGYRFVEWSDGYRNATRRDERVIELIDVYAKFEWRNIDDFEYHYNYATDDYDDDSLTLARGNTENVKCAVPKRDYFKFDGWYLDEAFTEKASDEKGNLLLGEKIFDSPSRDLYAKWVADEEYAVNYKILMVYVTAVDGEFTDGGRRVNVRYRMSESDKLRCRLITEQFKDKLNGMLDGLVDFQVDSYFTAAVIHDNSFKSENGSPFLYADDIPELKVGGVLEGYRSVITLFSLGGAENLIPPSTGMGGAKYGSVALDAKIARLGSFEQVVKATDYNDGLTGACVRELIRTIEPSAVCYEYARAYSWYIPTEIIDKLYLLNQWACELPWNIEIAELKGVWGDYEKGGIHYSTWANRILTVALDAECRNGLDGEDKGGSIVFGNPDDRDGWRKLTDGYIMKVPEHSRTVWFGAAAKPGYKFLNWSDGSTDAMRQISDVAKDTTLAARFERLAYTVEYRASGGGRIEGEAIQTVLTGENTKPVIAVADEGYRFVGWSDTVRYDDGNDSGVRYDVVGVQKYDEYGNPYYRLGFIVTAIFEKVVS